MENQTLLNLTATFVNITGFNNTASGKDGDNYNYGDKGDAYRRKSTS